MDTLEQYISKNHASILHEYKRANTPFYYVADVEYHPITSGFGCGASGSNERFVIKNGTYLKNGEVHLHLVSLDVEGHKASVELSKAHFKIVRVDKSIGAMGRPIPNSREVKYITINGRDYTITQLRWRHYKTNELCGRIWVTCDQDEPSIAYGQKHQPYYELYSQVGGTWSLKHTKSYDSVARAQYEIKHNVTMREFKETVFGDANIKIKCQLFGDK